MERSERGGTCGDPLLDAIRASGVLLDPQRTPDGVHIEGTLGVGDRTTTLRLTPPRRSRRPRISVPSETALGRIPHVEPSGNVCYQSDEGLVLDRYRPEAVAVESVRLAAGVLADGVSGRNHGDFANEWETYWSPLCTRSLAFVAELPRGIDRLVTAERAETRPKKRTHPVWIDGYAGRSVSDIAEFYNGVPYEEAHTVRGALYVPLRAGTVLVPPTADRFWTPSQARAAVRSSLAPDALADLDRMTGKGRTRKTVTVIVSLPRPSGGVALFGLRFSGIRDAHPLTPGGFASAVRPLRIERWDPAYLPPRGGASADLSGRHVILAGCGAVGGHLAFELARAGVSRLTLVDPDRLRPENTFRHALGREYWGRAKARALKTALERHAPFLRVEALTARIEEAIDDGRIALADADLLVVALGSPTVELDLNEALWSRDAAPPALFTWLEPLGVGGHALLTRPGAGRGCYECLHAPPDDTADALHNRAAFAAPDQDFARATAGCGSLHTPYASADALQTVALAARLATDALLGREPGSPIRSWKGDPAAFLGAGFRLTPRFDIAAERLGDLRYAHQSPTCPVCASARLSGE